MPSKLASAAPTLLRLVIPAMLGAALLLFRSHPGLAFVAFALGTLVASYAFFSRRLMRMLSRAALANDLDAITALASGSEVTSRFIGHLVLAHHGRYLSEERVFPCTCGSCERDALDEELEVARRFTRLVWTGRASEVVTAATKRVTEPTTNGALSAVLSSTLLPYRGATLALALALDPGEREGIDAAELAIDLATQLPLVQWPLRLAAASRRAREGKREEARQLTAGMPAWPAGSPLERQREALMETLREA